MYCYLYQSSQIIETIGWYWTFHIDKVHECISSSLINEISLTSIHVNGSLGGYKRVELFQLLKKGKGFLCSSVKVINFMRYNWIMSLPFKERWHEPGDQYEDVSLNKNEIKFKLRKGKNLSSIGMRVFHNL